MRSRASNVVLTALAALTGVVILGGCKQTGTREAGEAVHFRTEDGFNLQGTLYGSGSKGVVLAHMFSSDQTSWFEFAKVLEGRGYLILAFDFRGYGESEGEKEISLIDRDVRSAAAFLTEQRAATGGVALIGASMGGTASVIAGERSAGVRGIATLSAPVEFRGLNSSGVHLGNLPFPKLFIAARSDAAASSAEELYKASTPNAEIRIVPGSDHGTDLLKGDRAAEVTGELIAFLEKVFSPIAIA